MITKITKRLFLYSFLFMLIPAVLYSQPTDEDILASIELGVPWLVTQQNPDGSWGASESVAYTGFALTKLCDYAYEHGYHPFDPAYDFYSNVSTGFDFIFSNVKTHGTGTGLYSLEGTDVHHETYNAAIALMAIAVSKNPTGNVTVGMAAGSTFKDVQDEMVAYFAWSQLQHTDGGWGYYPTYPTSDNSHTGYATIALKYAETEGSIIPNSLKANLSVYIDYIQNDVSGGSGYMSPTQWVNLLKTGNLLTEMAFVGDALSDTRVQNALGFIETNWNAYNTGIYEYGIGDPQTMYCLMKGLESFGIEIITVTNPDDTDWFEVFSTDLVTTQHPAGYWPNENSIWDNDLLNTCWALFVLEKIAPPPVCPENIFVNNDAGVCGAIVDFVVSGPYWATIELIYGLPPEDLFPVGVTDQLFEIDRGEGDIVECSFTVTVTDTEPPDAVCENITVELDEFGEASIVPDDIDGGTEDNCSFILEASPLEFTCGNLGENEVTLIATDPAGNMDECKAIVTVVDVIAPVITATTVPFILGPVNHRYVTFTLDDFAIEVSDNCSEPEISDVKIVRVTSDEAEDAIDEGDGDPDGTTLDDIVISNDCQSVDLRKERAGSGNGRVYTIFLEVEDESGNTASTFILVHVPHNKFAVTTDDGPIYEVLGDCGEAIVAEMEKSGMILDKPMEFEGYELTNYPNPFNNSTTIQFAIPVESKVLLRVYNIFGQEVRTVVNQKYGQGTHTIQFNGSELPNGQYLYRFETSDYSQTKKMILNR